MKRAPRRPASGPAGQRAPASAAAAPQPPWPPPAAAGRSVRTASASPATGTAGVAAARAARRRRRSRSGSRAPIRCAQLQQGAMVHVLVQAAGPQQRQAHAALPGARRSVGPAPPLASPGAPAVVPICRNILLIRWTLEAIFLVVGCLGCLVGPGWRQEEVSEPGCPPPGAADREALRRGPPGPRGSVFIIVGVVHIPALPAPPFQQAAGQVGTTAPSPEKRNPERHF